MFFEQSNPRVMFHYGYGRCFQLVHKVIHNFCGKLPQALWRLGVLEFRPL